MAAFPVNNQGFQHKYVNSTAVRQGQYRWVSTSSSTEFKYFVAHLYPIGWHQISHKRVICSWVFNYIIIHHSQGNLDLELCNDRLHDVFVSEFNGNDKSPTS
ncbi:hypothetical protein K1T71_008227 [Dendrolimus kikuchii]|uniref:Uncharacterized protein n=1 Tax=Dendrolimus kikuchii TaxID=765133 RepID=A0ACC1CXJ5_9NEOP|nr:hypothetical protein K1T71_008227 [Dendrolimus kikuchii]